MPLKRSLCVRRTPGSRVSATGLPESSKPATGRWRICVMRGITCAHGMTDLQD